jgi:hypothetical protein
MSLSSSSLSSSKKPWCKVCKDSGEPESVYSTHFVKDNKGKPICPKLLALNCRTCGESGHTVKFCKKAAAVVLTEKKALLPPVTKKKTDEKKVNNMYDLLFVNEEEEDKVEDFPMMFQNTKAKAKEKDDLWGGRKVNKKSLPMSYAAAATSKKKQQDEPKIVFEFQAKEKKKSRWADAESSSDEEEEEFI